MKLRALWASFLFLAYTALTLLFTYPLIRYFGTHHVGEAGGDAKIYLWDYWWVARALSEGTSPLSTDAIFHPIGIGLAFHTLAPLQGATFFLTRGVLGDVGAANFIVIWTFVASALATYALAREVGAGRGGGFVAGVVFAFCPYRLARLAGHYDLLGTEWIPIFVLLLLKSRERRWLAAGAGVAAAAAAYTAATYAVFLALFAAVLLVYRRELWLLRRVALSGGVGLLLLTPLLWQASLDLSAWSYPPYPGTDRYSATLSAYVTPPGDGGPTTANKTETTVFAGYAVLALGCLGVVRRRSHPALPFWLTSAVVFLALSLGGPPFELLRELPLLENLRAPARLSVLVMLSLAIVAALVGKGVPLFDREATPERDGAGTASPTDDASRKVTVRNHPFFAFAEKGYPFLITPVLVFEFLRPVPLFRSEVPSVYESLAGERDGLTVVEIPGIEQSPAEVMFHQTVHGHPIFIGTAARVPREKADYYMGLPLVRPLIELRKGRGSPMEGLLEADRQSAPAVARFLGLGYFVLNRAYEKRGVIDFVEGVLPVERWYEDDERVVLRTRREDLPPDPDVIDAGSPESRQHFESGWERPEREADFAFRWANRERSTLLFRPPRGAQSLILEVAAFSVIELELGPERFSLSPGWQEIRVPLEPATSPNAHVERVTLRWSKLTEPSESDPRRLAARIRRIRFE